MRRASSQKRFGRRHFSEATAEQWNDWRWQLRKRIRSLAGLERIFELSDREREAVAEMGDALPVGVTPYYTSLMDVSDPAEALRRTMIPVVDEFTRTAGEADDPLDWRGFTRLGMTRLSIPRRYERRGFVPPAGSVEFPIYLG